MEKKKLKIIVRSLTAEEPEPSFKGHSIEAAKIKVIWAGSEVD